jgi:hypothetical protein
VISCSAVYGHTLRLGGLLLAAIIVAGLSGCAGEDPALAAMRSRLKQQAQLSPEELGRLLDHLSAELSKKDVTFLQDGVVMELDAPQQDVALGMLKERAGVFDEGMRVAGETTLRIINAPGRSPNAENPATRRLLVDVETLLPRRFEYSLDVPDPSAYSLDLVVE